MLLEALGMATNVEPLWAVMIALAGAKVVGETDGLSLLIRRHASSEATWHRTLADLPGAMSLGPLSSPWLLWIAFGGWFAIIIGLLLWRLCRL